MRYKIWNELKKADYVRLIEFLNENLSASIELFPGMDLESISVSPLVVAVEGSGKSMRAHRNVVVEMRH